MPSPQPPAVPETMLRRKGARKPAEVPADVLTFLERGELETVNLSEWLAVDQVALIEHCFPAMDLKTHVAPLRSLIQATKKPTTIKIVKLVGHYLHEQYSEPRARQEVFTSLSTHPSDSIRCYAPFLKGLDEQLRIDEKLEQSLVSASDRHFGVREVAWMALRPAIAADLSLAIPYLESWTLSPDENVRRFASESTRPRGVWCKHIPELKEHPELAACLLDPLHNDASRYVQNSVANWLHDAGKSRPDFVRERCAAWQAASPTEETAYIVKRSLRNL